MNNIAFIFISAPHGKNVGREGLDALLATTVLNIEIGVFFVGDGVFQIIETQQPSVILSRNYIITFKVLPLYGINDIWICKTSMIDRGLQVNNTKLVINAVPICSSIVRDKLSCYDKILTF